MDDLRKQLELHPKQKKIGSFSACSNVTGIITNMQAVTNLLHEFGALSFYDCAAAGP